MIYITGRRAVFDEDKLLAKPYNNNMHSSMEITNKIRNKAIGKYVNQQDFAHKKRFKKSFGKDTPKKKKKHKLSNTSNNSSRRISDSLSYSLSISVDVPSTASHKSTSSIHTPNQIYLYSEHYSKAFFESDNNKKNKKSWQKLFSFGIHKKKKKKQSNYSDEEESSFKSLTLDDPSDVANANRRKLISSHTAVKDDMFSDMILNSRYSIHGFDFAQSMYKTSFQIQEITETVNANNLKRGDIICVMDYEMIDVENEDLNSFLTKYKNAKLFEKDGRGRKKKTNRIRNGSTTINRPFIIKTKIMFFKSTKT